MKSLDTPRIKLEPLRETHAEGMYSGLSDKQLYEFIDEKPPESIEALRNRYKRLESRRSPKGDEYWLNWIILVKPELHTAGYVQATVSGTSAIVAYVLFKNAWGLGFARESVLAMLTHLQDEYSVRRIVATVDTRNHRSIRLLESIGFSLSKTRKCDGSAQVLCGDEAEYVLSVS